MLSYAKYILLKKNSSERDLVGFYLSHQFPRFSVNSIQVKQCYFFRMWPLISVANFFRKKCCCCTISWKCCGIVTLVIVIIIGAIIGGGALWLRNKWVKQCCQLWKNIQSWQHWSLFNFIKTGEGRFITLISLL